MGKKQGTLRSVVGRGETSLLCDPASELLVEIESRIARVILNNETPVQPVFVWKVVTKASKTSETTGDFSIFPRLAFLF